jgi:hypothetical protein
MLSALVRGLAAFVIVMLCSCHGVTAVLTAWPVCSDELIRQVTINCAERGLLLLRVRDEIRMTIAAYQTLYESSIAFGMRSALMSEQRKAELEAKARGACLVLAVVWRGCRSARMVCLLRADQTAAGGVC